MDPYFQVNKVFDNEIAPLLLGSVQDDQKQILKGTSISEINPFVININLDALNESMSVLVNEVKPYLITKIHSLFNGICMESLKDAKLVPGLYRRTQRTVSTHSSYVETCLIPWNEFLDRSEPVFGKGRDGVSMSIKFYEGLINSFRTLLEEILEGIRKTEESLKRFNRRGAASNNSGTTKSMASFSDEDRIRRQFQLDAEFMKQKITANLDVRYKTGLSVTLQTEFDQLLEIVAIAPAAESDTAVADQ
jgi:hypothetical protein